MSCWQKYQLPLNVCVGAMEVSIYQWIFLKSTWLRFTPIFIEILLPAWWRCQDRSFPAPRVLPNNEPRMRAKHTVQNTERPNRKHWFSPHTHPAKFKILTKKKQERMFLEGKMDSMVSISFVFPPPSVYYSVPGQVLRVMTKMYSQPVTDAAHWTWQVVGVSVWSKTRIWYEENSIWCEYDLKSFTIWASREYI